MSTILRLISMAFVGLTTALSAAAFTNPADSLVIRFANRTRMVIYAPDKAGIQALSNYDLNKIVREMGMQLDSVPGGQAAISRNGDQYLKDTVLVVRKKKNGVTITINGSGDTIRTDSDRNNRDDSDRDYERARRRKREGDGWDFSFDGGGLGLTNFVQRNTVPGYSEESYSLRPLGSRYVSVALGVMPTIIRGKRASLKLYYGVELAWNNFMFENDVIPEKTPGGIAFTDAGRDLKKSKLTVCTLGIPVVPRVTFYNSQNRKVCHIGLGGYANYRIDSYRKIKELDGDKDRRHSNFDLANYRYGLMAHLGIGKTDFFVKYDLSPVFKEGKGPDVRAVSFGFGL